MSVPRNRVLISAMVLALLISVSAIAQERMSPQLADFLRFVDANHFSRMTEAQYNSMTPAEWAWILGKAYETEFEWAFTNTNNRTRDEKMLYLMLLWEELQDYVTEASARYTEKEYSGPYFRAYLVYGFYGFDQNGCYEYKLYHDGEESSLTIIKDTGSQLILDVWSSRFTLQRVE